jgi:hypothetical protein
MIIFPFADGATLALSRSGLNVTSVQNLGHNISDHSICFGDNVMLVAGSQVPILPKVTNICNYKYF